MHRIPQAKEPAYRRPAESGAPGAAPALSVPDLSALDLHGGTAGGRALSDLHCKILYWAARGATLEATAARLDLSAGEVLEAVAPLSEAGLVALRPAPRTARRDTLARVWDEAADRHAARPFLVPSGGTALSYAEAAQRVDAIARRLAGAGLGKGSRILIHAEPGVEPALLFWAAVRLGIVVAMIDTAWGEVALLNALHLVRPSLVFADPPRAPLARGARRPVVVLEASHGDPDRLGAWLAAGSGMDAAPLIGEDDPAAILFTSGTTGDPKGVELTQGALVRTARLLAERCGIRAGDRLLTLVEGHCVSGLRNPLILTAMTGAAAVLPAGAERRDPRAIAELCRRGGVSVLSTMPACLKALAAGTPLEGVRLILSTGAPLPAATAERLRGLTDAAVRSYYGLTETAGVCVVEPPGGAAPGALGVPRGVVAQVVDGEGRVLPPGEAGELRLYGANLASSFLGQPSPLRDGWLHTGDRALWRDGQLVLLGRLREAVKTPRGDLLPFTEIEAVLERDPAVAEAAVRAIEKEGEEDGEERTLAFIRLMEGAAADGVVGRVMQRALEAFGPRAAPVAVRIVSDFPRAANGKMRRDALPDRLSDA